MTFWPGGFSLRYERDYVLNVPFKWDTQYLFITNQYYDSQIYVLPIYSQQDHLIQNVSLSADFNPIVHYDLSQYLAQLILVCHEADDAFQEDIQTIFSVDKETKENKELGLLYKRGPVKRLERCYAKCQSDYRDERFPTAAHVLDIIRCSLVFHDVSCMFPVVICLFLSILWREVTECLSVSTRSITNPCNGPSSDRYK